MLRTTWKSLSCSGVMSGRRNCDMRTYMRYSISLRHRSGKTRRHLPPSCQTTTRSPFAWLSHRAQSVRSPLPPSHPLDDSSLTVPSDWDQLDTGIDCPIQFSAEEIAAHDEKAEAWNKIADFWSALDGFVSRDGWTSLENYERAKAFFEELRNEGLKQLSGEELADFQSRWVVGKD